MNTKGSIALITMHDLDSTLCRTTEIEILKHLGLRGYHTTLFATRSTKSYHGMEVDFPIFAIPMRDVPLVSAFFLGVILFFIIPVYSLMKRPRFFVICGQGAWAFSFVPWKPVLSRCLKTKVILDIRSNPVEVKGRLAALRALLFDVFVLLGRCRAFDGMTIITESMRNEISKKFHLDPKLFGVWTEGVSTELFDPTRYMQDAQRLRQELGLVGKIVVLYHGTFSPDRGIIESIEAMANVKASDVVLFLLGSGPALAKMKATIQRCGVQGRVIVHDSVTYMDVPKYIAMSDVGLVPLPNTPDWVHQNPLNLLECLAMEKSVILTDIPANRSVVGENKCAIYVSSAEPLRFAQAMSYVSEHLQAVRKRGLVGRTLIRGKYDWFSVSECLDHYLMCLT